MKEEAACLASFRHTLRWSPSPMMWVEGWKGKFRYKGMNTRDKYSYTVMVRSYPVVGFGIRPLDGR